MATYTDNSPMPFGKFKGTKMANVPSRYLLWLFEKTNRKDLEIGLRLYIMDNMDALKKDVQDSDDGN